MGGVRVRLVSSFEELQHIVNGKKLDAELVSKGWDEVEAQAQDEVLRLYRWEPEPTKRGHNAGTRTEGAHFAKEMRGWLQRPWTEIVTAIGKSSNDTTLDGNASERIAYKMLRFKRDPMNRERTMVVAFNCAFSKYNSRILREIERQAAFLNGLNPFAPILLLTEEEDYRRYLEEKVSRDD